MTTNKVLRVTLDLCRGGSRDDRSRRNPQWELPAAEAIPLEKLLIQTLLGSWARTVEFPDLDPEPDPDPDRDSSGYRGIWVVRSDPTPGEFRSVRVYGPYVEVAAAATTEATSQELKLHFFDPERSAEDFLLRSAPPDVLPPSLADLVRNTPIV